ncbi:MAG: thioesterase family protein, partial [Actinomycetota bacterium]|nr:thioesterase family protein [Actinomycetota bacterium]
GPHGGYLAAIITRALIEAVADRARSPRSLTIHYARAPAPGPVSIHTVHERKGRSLSTVSARMEQEGSLIALALGALSVPWSAPEILDEGPMPAVAPPDRVRETAPALVERVEKGLAPSFLRQIVLQPRLGSLPFTGSDGPMEVGAWLGVRDETRPVDAISLALFADALPSSPFPRLSEPATSPTVDLTIHFRAHAAPVRGEEPGLCFARFRSRMVHEGFFEEDGEIWSAHGRLLAQSRQLAILMPLGKR